MWHFIRMARAEKKATAAFVFSCGGGFYIFILSYIYFTFSFFKKKEEEEDEEIFITFLKPCPTNSKVNPINHSRIGH